MEGVQVEKKRVTIDLAQHPELEEPGAVLYVRPASILIVRGKRRYRAFSSVCPHKPKKKYRVFSRREDPQRPCFQCAVHGWSWDHKGRATGKAKKALRRFPVKEKDGQLVVRLK